MYEYLHDEKFARRRRERRSIAAKYGHIKRRLRSGDTVGVKRIQKEGFSYGRVTIAKAHEGRSVFYVGKRPHPMLE